MDGVHINSFKHLSNSGKIIFLLDSFDEMAQKLNRNTIRENLHELLSGVRGNSRVVMTSRPTYFENKSERLLILENTVEEQNHSIDKQ